MTKNRGGRPRIENRLKVKSKRVSFALTQGEWVLLKSRFKTAGKTATQYCKEAVFNAKVQAAIPDEERHALMNLHKLGQRVSQLFVQGSLKKNVAALAEFNAFVADFKRIKEYLKDKASRL